MRRTFCTIWMFTRRRRRRGAASVGGTEACIAEDVPAIFDLLLSIICSVNIVVDY